jgi:cell division protein FtsQ
MTGNHKRWAGIARQQHHAEVLPRLLITAAGVAAVLFAMVVGFRVSNFTVTGNTAYTDEEVREASGVEMGENLVLLYKSNIASSILANLPYVETVRVVRELPGTVRVELTEGTAAAAVLSEYGDWWLVSSGGKLMEEIDETTAASWLRVTGVTVQLPEEGDMMELDQGTETLTTILNALNEIGITDLTVLDLSDESDIIAWCGDRYQIKLGGSEDLDYKLQFLDTVLDNLGEDYEGVIDLTFSEDDAAHFHPWS